MVVFSSKFEQRPIKRSINYPKSQNLSRRSFVLNQRPLDEVDQAEYEILDTKIFDEEIPEVSEISKHIVKVKIVNAVKNNFISNSFLNIPD